MTATIMRPVLFAHAAAIVVLLLGLGLLLPPPAISDHEMMEYVGQGVINPGCNNLNCWRILAAAIVERFPGPSLPRWRTYAALGNTAGALLTAQLALSLGLSARTAPLAMWLSAMSVGSFTTLYHPYTSDSMIFFLAPLAMLLLVRDRVRAATIVAGVGIFAKEFAAAPLYIEAIAAAVRRQWPRFRRLFLLAVGVTVWWIAFQISLMIFFGYRYDANPSIDILRGGYFWFWFRHVGPKVAVTTVFSAFGAVWLLAIAGLVRGPERFRALAAGCVVPALAFMYVETPDRALFNFFFLLAPLAAMVLTQLPAAVAWLFVGAYSLANLRLGTAWDVVPEARYPLAVSLVLAVAAIAISWRTQAVHPPLSESHARVG